MAQILVIAATLAALWYWIGFCHRTHGWTKTLIKTTSVAGLAGAAALSGGPGLLVVALGLGALGDYFLSRPGQGAFLAGLVSFALAHLAYVGLLIGAGSVAAPTAATGAVVLGSLAMAALLFSYAGALRWPVMVYVAIITSMAVLALGLPNGIWLGTVAALLFVVSDAVLGLEMFVLSARHRARGVTPFVVWGTYWAAQLLFLIAFGGVWAA